MGSLFIQIGQCGCQIGAQLNPRLSSSYYCTRTRPPNRVHAIMIDTEPKVIQSLVSLNPKWLDPLNTRHFQHGRGNNWSYGYMHHLPPNKLYQEFLPQHRQHSHIQLSPLTLERYTTENRAIWDFTLERVRRELETVDCAMAINVISSLGGGTGSGLGTKIIEKLGEELSIDILGHFVLPNKSGETPLQVYNCLLSLSNTHQHCSAIFTYENDKMMSLFRTMQQKESSLDDINAHLASNIARFIHINDMPKLGRFYSTVASDCILSPQLKYLNLFSVDSKNGEQEDMHSLLIDQLKNYQHDAYGEQFGGGDRGHLLHGELLLLGKEQPMMEPRTTKKLKNVLNPLFEDSLNVQEVKKGKEEGCSAVLVANHTSILSYLQYLITSGTQKLQARAYLWHYQYADIEGAIEAVQGVADQYYYLAHSSEAG